jgi:serine protease Do
MTDHAINLAAAALEHLTGSMRGEVSWVTGSAVDAQLEAEQRLVLVPADPNGPVPQTIARFRQVGNSYEIEAPEGRQLWVNGQRIQMSQLHYGDVIEFGETGPLSRFRLYDDAHRPGITVGEILGDVISYVKTSRKPMHRKLGFASAELLRRLARDTSLIFRAAILLAIALLAFVVYQQYRSNQSLRAQIERGNLQIDSIATELTQAQRDSIHLRDLTALEEELDVRLSSNAKRLEALEARSGASARVISMAAPSVAFLQGGYGLRHRESERMLRHVLDEDGLKVYFPNGQPYLTLDGTGPVAEVNFTGTGFVLAGQRMLVTNRHVAEPWIKSPGMRIGSEELEPVMIRLIAYFPSQSEPVAIELIGTSDSVDLAVLRMTTVPAGVAGLALAEKQATPGEEVIVMGYPTGLKSLLAQSGSAFLKNLKRSAQTGFWIVAEKLAAANLIAPLSSRGIVGQATQATVVYDAETTHGGSGGPVLNTNGLVVAVNTAIIPEYGGSNLGVPVAHIHALLTGLNGKPRKGSKN